MATLDDRRIAAIVEQVVQRLAAEGAAPAPPAPRHSPTPLAPRTSRAAAGDRGVFCDVDSAVAAANEAHREWRETPVSTRELCICAIRRFMLENLELMSRRAIDETGLGRYEDKLVKNRLAATKTQGTEALEPLVMTGDNGMTLIERAPYGVIASITPCTNPTETLCNNAIAMIASGNTVVFNVHPLAKELSAWTVQGFNDAIVSKGGPPNVVCCVMPPTIASAQALMTHAGVRVVGVTGGGEVVRAAMSSGKRAVAAGPGNPPVVVDETADLELAGRGYVAGGSFDNCIVCVCEKEMICVASVADAMKQSLRDHGAYELRGREIDTVARLVVDGDHPRRDWIGKDATKILDAAGIRAPASTRMIFAEVDEAHPFVQAELLMPVHGFVRVPNVQDGIEMAVRVEHGFRHTAGMYSRNIDALHRMARAVDTSIFVKNAPHFAGLGAGGEGYTAWTIASPTGDGCTNARTWTRERRCTLVQYFRIV